MMIATNSSIMGDLMLPEPMPAGGCPATIAMPAVTIGSVAP